MLQWMGGSRKKVYMSRNSTQIRQRQYFEQKKLLQQQNKNDVAGGQAYSQDKEARSLDVLNINEVATACCNHNEPANAEGAIQLYDFTRSEASPTESLKNLTFQSNSSMNETGPKPRLLSSFGHQDVVAAVNYHEQPLGCKISPSINYSTRQQNQNLGLESEISLIDLGIYEGSKNKSTARDVHVSLSVEGLGHMKMETPPHSTIPNKRDLPLPPHKAKRSIPFDITKALDSINVLNEQRPSDKISIILDESEHVRRKQFNCYSSDSFKNHNADLNLEDEDMFYEPRAKKDLQLKRSRSGGNLADENSDGLWRIDNLISKDHFHSSGDEHFDTFDYGCKDKYSPGQRNSTRSTTRFDSTGIPSSHVLFSDCSFMDDDMGTELFEWERHPASKKIFNSNSSFGPSAWHFDMGDDSERRWSPISEESCSTAAAMKDRPCKKPSKSVKDEMNKKDEFHMSLDELDIPNMDADLHGVSIFSNPEKVGHKRTTDQKKLETGCWPERVTEQPRTQEPNCCLSLNEKFSSWGSTGLSIVMHEDKPSFKSASDMGPYQTETTEKRPAHKVRSDVIGPDNVFFEDDTHMQHAVSDIFGDKTEMSNPFRAKDLRSDIDIGTLLGHNEDKKQEDNFATFSNRDADIFPAKKAANSVRQTVGGHSMRLQPSRTDSFRHGFTSDFSFQESEPKTFWEDRHVSNDTFLGELSGLLATENENNNKNDGKIEASEKQIPANLSCLQETSVELIQDHELVRPVTTEKLDDPSVDYEAPSHLRNKTHDVQDQSEINAMFQSPFVGEVVIEKKIIASALPDNTDLQYQFMLEQHVLQRLCIQKIVVPTPMKDKLDKDKRFMMTEDGSHVLSRSV